MASTIKATNISTPDGTGNITVDRPLSGSGASLTSLPAANITGTLPAIDGSSLTGLVTPKMKMLHTTYAFSGPPGTQAISGVGFAPDAIFGMWGVGNTDLCGPCIFWAINPSSSLAQSGTRNFNAWRHNEGTTPDSWMWANAGMQWADNSTNYFQATVTTWGSDGITITYTVTGSPATGPTMNQGTVFFKLT
jgi:hypothetical protein